MKCLLGQVPYSGLHQHLLPTCFFVDVIYFKEMECLLDGSSFRLAAGVSVFLCRENLKFCV